MKKKQAIEHDDTNGTNAEECVDCGCSPCTCGEQWETEIEESERVEKENKEAQANATTFPLTRTFVHCDSTGRELSYVSVTATVTLTRINGVTLTPNEIERRFRRNFYLSFKGGKASGESGVLNGGAATAESTRPRRTMSPEHKQKLQEARQRRNDGKPARSTDDGPSPETVKLATVLLDGFSKLERSEGSAWFGKGACLKACSIVYVDAQSWTLAIRYLLDTAQIEARGEKRGREYRRVKATKGGAAK